MVAAWGSQHVVRKQEQNEIWSKTLFNSYLLFFRNVSLGYCVFATLQTSFNCTSLTPPGVII